MTQTFLLIASIVATILAIVAVGAVLWVISRPKKVETPGPQNNWQNEDYLNFEKAGKLRSQSGFNLEDGWGNPYL